VIRELITGIYQLRDRLLLVLDPDRVLAALGGGVSTFRPPAELHGVLGQATAMN
jgi:hypothetical protein